MRDVAWCPNIGAPYDIIVTCSEDKSAIVWRKHKNEDRFYKVGEENCAGACWRASWNFSGTLVAISCVSV